MPSEHLKHVALDRISEVVDRVLAESEIYKEEINKSEFVQYFATRMENGLSPEELLSISKEELGRRIKQTMAVDVLAGLLNDLSPEEMEIFEAAVEGG